MVTRRFSGCSCFEVGVETDGKGQVAGGVITKFTLRRLAGCIVEITQDDENTYTIAVGGGDEANELSRALIWTGQELQRRMDENAQGT